MKPAKSIIYMSCVSMSCVLAASGLSGCGKKHQDGAPPTALAPAGATAAPTQEAVVTVDQTQMDSPIKTNADGAIVIPDASAADDAGHWAPIAGPEVEDAGHWAPIQGQDTPNSEAPGDGRAEEQKKTVLFPIVSDHRQGDEQTFDIIQPRPTRENGAGEGAMVGVRFAVRAGTPEIASGSLGFLVAHYYEHTGLLKGIRYHYDGILTEISPGIGGFEASIGYAKSDGQTMPLFIYMPIAGKTTVLKAAFYHAWNSHNQTWNGPAKGAIAPGINYLGSEYEWTPAPVFPISALKFSVGAFARISNEQRGTPSFFNARISIATPALPIGISWPEKHR